MDTCCVAFELTMAAEYKWTRTFTGIFLHTDQIRQMSPIYYFYWLNHIKYTKKKIVRHDNAVYFGLGWNSFTYENTALAQTITTFAKKK